MDERTQFFLCVLAGAGGFGGLLGLFGGLVGIVALREGRGGGTVFGLSVAEAFTRISERDLHPILRAGLVGLIDGLVFGIVVGTVVGTFAAWQHPAEWRTLRRALVGMTLLVLAAISLGLLAGWSVRR